MSHESSVRPADSGTHQRWNNSALLHASKTICAGASNVRVTTSSRSDLRSTTVRFTTALLSFASGICLLLPAQVPDDFVQSVETRAPHLAVLLDPGGLFFQPAPPELAGAYPPHLLRGHQPRLLQHADVLLHAREGHLESLGKIGDRGIRIPELIQHATPRDIGERGERRVEAGLILNHLVQCISRMG